MEERHILKFRKYIKMGSGNWNACKFKIRMNKLVNVKQEMIFFFRKIIYPVSPLLGRKDCGYKATQGQPACQVFGRQSDSFIFFD